MVSFSAPTLAQRHSPSWKSIPCTLLLLQPHALSTNNPGKHPVLRPFPAPCCGPLAPRGSLRAVSRSAVSRSAVSRRAVSRRAVSRDRPAAALRDTERGARPVPRRDRADTAADRDEQRPDGTTARGGGRSLVTAAVRSEAGPRAEGRGAPPGGAPLPGCAQSAQRSLPVPAALCSSSSSALLRSRSIAPGARRGVCGRLGLAGK